MALGWTLLHFCWQGAAIAGLLWCVLGLLSGRSARVRYGVACLALAGMVVVPVATFVRLIGVARPPVVTAGLMERIELPVMEMSGAAPAVSPMPLKARVSGLLDEAAPWVPAVWVVGVLLFLGRLNVGLMVARRMKTAGTEAASDELQRVFEELKARLGIGRVVRLVNSARVQVPTVIGWLRPVVLLPVGCFMGLSAVQVEALLAHELAHIRRHDYLVSVLQSAVEALLFYHPAVWWVSRQVRRERECCCDDLAVEMGGDRLAYARALSRLEEYRAAMPEIALGANGGVLTMRIRRLLGYREGSVRSQVAAVAVLLLLAASVVLGVSASARAQLDTAVRKVPATLTGKDGASLGNAKSGPVEVADAKPGAAQTGALARDGSGAPTVAPTGAMLALYTSLRRGKGTRCGIPATT